MLKLYVSCIILFWILNSLGCKSDANEITTKPMSDVSEQMNVNQALESTPAANPKNFIPQELSTVNSFTTTVSEGVGELNIIDTLSAKEETRLKQKSIRTKAITIEPDAFSGIVCENQRESCSGLCNATDAMYYDIKCSCDIHCQIYKTCCEDFKQSCPDLWLEAQQTYGNLLDLKIDCLESYSLGYLVIASCPKDDQVQDVVRKNCDNSILEQPISVGDVHFKNIACMRCNGFNDSKHLLWDIGVFLHAENSRNWLEGPGFLKSEHTGTILKWNPPNSNVKECSNNIIDSCPESTSHDLTSKCKRINSYVKVSVDNNLRLFDIYSNTYCIKCNIGTNSPCQVIAISEFREHKHSHLSTLVKWTSSPDLTSHGIFEGSSRTQWKQMNCTGSIQKWSSLQCSVTECWTKLEPVNGICPRRKSASCILFVFKWYHIYLNGVDGTDHTMIPSSIEKLLKIYVQDVYFTNNLNVWSTNNSVTGSVTLENEDSLPLNDRRADIIPIISIGLSKQRFHGEFSFCIIKTAEYGTGLPLPSDCILYTNCTIPKISDNMHVMVESSASKIYKAGPCIVVILIYLLKTLQSIVSTAFRA